MCLNSIVKAGQRGGTGPLAAVAPCKKIVLYAFVVSFVHIYLFHCPALHFNVLQLLHHFYSLHPFLVFPSARVSVLES